jgi:hypothetical protein
MAVWFDSIRDSFVTCDVTERHFLYLISTGRCLCAVKNALSHFVLGLCTRVCSLLAASCFQKCQSTVLGNWGSRAGCASNRTEPQEGAGKVIEPTVVPQHHTFSVFLGRLVTSVGYLPFAHNPQPIRRHQVIPQDRYVPAKLERTNNNNQSFLCTFVFFPVVVRQKFCYILLFRDLWSSGILHSVDW